MSNSTTPTPSGPFAADQRISHRQSAAQTKAEAGLNMLRSGKWSDLKLRCGGQEFPVHRNIVCELSGFFRACVESGMKESNENVIDLVEENVDDVKRMLDFLYTDTYWEHPEEERGKTSSDDLYRSYNGQSKDSVEENKGREDDPMMVNARMFVLADKFEIPSLKLGVLKKVEGFWKAVKRRKSRLPVEFYYEDFPLSLETQRHCIQTQWQRVLDAADYCTSRASSDTRFADSLLNPVAHVVPSLAQESQEEGSRQFDDLMERLARNGDLCLRMFDLTCKHVDMKEREQKELAERKDEAVERFQEQVTVLMEMFAKILKHPEKSEDLRCYSDECPAPQLMVPVYEHDEPCSELEWVCKCCGIRCPVGDGTIDPGIRSE